MEYLSSYCLTEPNSGSDAKNMKTTAKKNDAGNWVINGTKAFISGGSVSDLYLVMTKTEDNKVTAFLVPKESKGLSFGKLENKMGWKN